MLAVFKISVIKIIKFVTFNMNPMFIKVTLSSFILVMEIFAQVVQKNLGLLVLLHVIRLVSVYHTQPVE